MTWIRGCVCALAVGMAFAYAPRAWSQAPQQDDKPAAAQDDKPAPPPVVHTGAELFQSSGCTHCHTMNGQGGTKGPDLSGVGRRLKQDAIKTQIQQGKGAMPPFQDALSDDEINALVRYLEKARSKK